MTEASSRIELLERHLQGDPQGAARLYAFYAERLGRLAQQHLSPKTSRWNCSRCG